MRNDWGVKALVALRSWGDCLQENRANKEANRVIVQRDRKSVV